MFDSEDEDTPSQPNNQNTSKMERETAGSEFKVAKMQMREKIHRMRDDDDETRSTMPVLASPSIGSSSVRATEAPSRAKIPAPVPSILDASDKEDYEATKPPKPAPAPAPAASSYRAPSPRIGSWRQQSPGRGGRTPRAEIQRRQARQTNDDSDSDLDDIAARGARDAMPSTSPLSLAPAMNGAKKKTYSRHASPARASPPKSPKAAPLPPTAPPVAVEDAGSKALLEMVTALQKEVAGLREQLQEQPSVGQVDKLQQQLRDQKSEMSALRSRMDMMQRQLGEMLSRPNQPPPPTASNSSPQMQLSQRGGIGSMNTSNAVVSAEVLPLHSMTANQSKGPDFTRASRQQATLSPTSRQNMDVQEKMKSWINEEMSTRSIIATPRGTNASDTTISGQTPTLARNVPPPPPDSESSNRPVDASVLKTPAPKIARINKTVMVLRQAIPGAQVSHSDKVGIGISFGMTAKGDVFITGMAPNGPAKASGQIKRGDQLVAVDDTEIRGWDVKEIVGLIVGHLDTQVRLQVASLPDGHASSPSMMSPRGEPPSTSTH